MSNIKTVLGLVAAKGAGKDTLAGFLIEDFAYLRLAFADALYAEAAEAYGTTVAALQARETKETPQEALAPIACRNPQFALYCLNWLAEQGREGGIHAPMSPREVLQLWGTWRRDTISQGYWLDQVAKAIDALPARSKVVITDVRYVNEASFLVATGGVLVRIRNVVAETAAAADTHPSETQLRGYECDLTVDNNGTLGQLRERAGELANQANELDVATLRAA